MTILFPSSSDIHWEHASSRYQCVTPGLIAQLQADFFAGRDLGETVPSLGREQAAIIVAETLEADRIVNLPPGKFLTDYRVGPDCDFKSAVLAEILFAVVEEARQEKNEKSEQEWRAYAMASLEQALNSPFASPTLWYEDIFWEIANNLGRDEADQKFAWLKRGLAHTLRFHEGGNALNFLRDLAETHLFMGNLDRGLEMFSSILRHDPADIWTYNAIALTFDRVGLTEIGAQAVRRALALLDAQGEHEKIRPQLERCSTKMAESKLQGRERECSPAVLQEMRAALALEFEAAEPRPLEELSRDLLPDFDAIQVKRPMKLSDIGLPDRAAILKQLRRSSSEQEAAQLEQFQNTTRARKRHKKH